MKIKGAIFDLDGTLLDSMDICQSCATLFVRSQGKEPDKDLDFKLEQMSVDEGNRYIQKAYFPELSAKDVADMVNSMLISLYSQRDMLKNGVSDMLRDMKDAGIKTAVATSNSYALATAALNGNGIGGYIDYTVSCDDVGRGKSFPDVYLKAASLLKLRPGEILVFEDSLYALETAKKAGFITVSVADKSNIGFRKELVFKSDFFIETFENWSDVLNV